MNGVVLAAGFGTRLYPLTRDRAKPLLPVGGRPVVERILEHLLDAPSVEEVVIVTNGRFQEEFRLWHSGLPFPWRLRTQLLCDGVAEPTKRLGAVRDLRLALGEVDPGDGYVVVAGDNLFDFPVTALIQAWRGDEGARGAIAVEEPVPIEERAGKGLACVDGEGRVVAFEEKPEEPSCDRPGASIYAFAPELPNWIDTYLDQGGNPDTPGHFLAWLVGRGTPIAGYPIPGYRFDIGTPERYEKARGFFEGGAPG